MERYCVKQKIIIIRAVLTIFFQFATATATVTTGQQYIVLLINVIGNEVCICIRDVFQKKGKRWEFFPRRGPPPPNMGTPRFVFEDVSYTDNELKD